MSSKCYLLDLPDEVFLSMAIKLTLTDLLSFMHSCRRFHVLVHESLLMQYLIRTMCHGLHDPLISDMSIPQRVNALEIWERAWLDLSMSEQSQRHQLVAIGLVDDLKRCTIQSGILIGTQFNSLHLSGSYFYLDFLHLLDRSKAVTRINLPNVGGDAHVQSWTYAPDSDLMVIACRSLFSSFWRTVITRFGRTDGRKRPPTLEFHQFSTGSHHPSAAKYSLELEQISATRATCMECCGDNMIIVILDGEDVGGGKSDYIFLIEWRIGRITQLRRAQPGTYGALVTFLSPDALVLAFRDTFALEVCKLSRASSDAALVLRTLCSLRLPTLLSGQQVADICLSQPSTLLTNHSSSSRRSLSAFPFRSDPDDDILAFDVYFRVNNGRRIIFVARRRALLSLTIPSGTRTLAPIRAWEDWGPRTTHWMELDPLNDSISLAGSRCVLVKYSHLRNHYVLDLRDFNPYRSRARNAQNKTATTHGVASLTVLSAEACFEEDVVSELPFRSIRKENVGKHVLLDDEWIGEILWDEDAEAEVIEIRTITSSALVFGR
ncbi:hypothetical protein BC827DRAFT_876446 [Russula dissimulans]|nr:hypothetical protein BC827DRAFT_876446 [Russula dissimulans]